MQTVGSEKLAVPTCTACAPAMMNSSASRPVAMPPRPITGIFTAPQACHTMRSAMGRMAGPDSPANTLLNTGRRFSRSMAIAWKVFTRLRASAPASAQAAAMSGMLSALGLSLTTSGFLHTARTRPTTSRALSALTP